MIRSYVAFNTLPTAITVVFMLMRQLLAATKIYGTQLLFAVFTCAVIAVIRKGLLANNSLDVVTSLLCITQRADVVSRPRCRCGIGFFLSTVLAT